jgi:transcriptional regulator with XRE-family HTH domain
MLLGYKIIDDMAINTAGRPMAEVSTSTAFGQWLRSERLKRGMTGEHLASLISESTKQGQVSSWERGAKNPEPKTVDQIAAALAGPDAEEDDIRRLARAGRKAAFLPDGEDDNAFDALGPFTEDEIEIAHDAIQAYRGTPDRATFKRVVGSFVQEVTEDTPVAEMSGQGKVGQLNRRIRGRESGRAGKE